jgi:putative transposase
VKKSRFTEEQIAFVLKQAETGTPVAEVLRRMGINEQTCLTLEEALCRLGHGRAAPAEATRGREPQAQAARCRSEPRQAHPVRHVLAKELRRLLGDASSCTRFRRRTG